MALLVLKEISRGEDNTKEIKEIDDYLYGFAKPKEYSGSKGAEVVYVKKYEEMSLILTKYSQKDSKKMTVMEYYQAYSMMRKESKANTKSRKK